MKLRNQINQAEIFANVVNLKPLKIGPYLKALPALISVDMFHVSLGCNRRHSTNIMQVKMVPTSPVDDMKHKRYQRPMK